MTIHPHPSIGVLPLVFRAATTDDAPALNRLIDAHQDEGHLLPRREDEIRLRIAHFLVVDVEGDVRGCAELVPLSARVAEVRSLVVCSDLRGHGVATHLLSELERRARDGRFAMLLALAHDPRFFIRHNYSIVPHEWLREKIERDCIGCALFRRCGQYAMVLSLSERQAAVGAAAAGRNVAAA